MATTPLGNRKEGGFWQPRKSSLWDMLSMEQNKGDKGSLGGPSRRRPKLRRGPAWRKATEAEADLGLSQIMVSHGTQVLKRCPHPPARPS